MKGRRHVWPKGAGTCIRKGCGRRRRRGHFQAWVFQDGTRGEFDGEEGTCKGEALPTVTVMGVTVQQDPEAPIPAALDDAARGGLGVLHVSTAGVRHVPASEVFRNPVEEALAPHGFLPVGLPGGVRGYARPSNAPGCAPFVVVPAGGAREVTTMTAPVDVVRGETIRLPFESVTQVVEFMSGIGGPGEDEQ